MVETVLTVLVCGIVGAALALVCGFAWDWWQKRRKEPSE